jgi:CDP-paratose synthetase
MKETVLLTGATGFLGSYLAKRLLCEGYKVIILKRSFSDIWRIKDILNDLIYYNIDEFSIEQPFKEHKKIDIVIHTATCYGRNSENVSKIVETNLLFPLRLIENAVLFNTDTFFNTDTLQYKYLNTYTLSKKQFVEWIKIFSKKIQIVNLKIEHMYGPKDDKSKFVTWLISEFLNNRCEIKLTKGEQKRDFIYIDDVVNAYIKILENREKLSSYEEFDVGTGKQIKIKDFVILTKQTVSSILNREVKTRLNFGALPYREGEFMEIKENIKPLLDLGWHPEVELEEGIKRTIIWEVKKL